MYSLTCSPAPLVQEKKKKYSKGLFGIQWVDLIYTSLVFSAILPIFCDQNTIYISFRNIYKLKKIN